MEKSRYVTLVGHVQSGKTYEEINYCYKSVKNQHLPVIFITRNIIADQLQLMSRVKEQNPELLITTLSSLDVARAIEFMNKKAILVVLCNHHQLYKTTMILNEYNGRYNVCIDEIDFSIKTKNVTSKIDIHLHFIKTNATSILGATATPVAVFSNEKTVDEIRYLKPNKRYHGINDLNVEFIDSDSFEDLSAIDTVYSAFLEKSNGVLLHSVTKKKHQQYFLMNTIHTRFPSITIVVYNGDGIKVICQHTIPFQKKKSVNSYGQNIQRYHVIKNVHFFEKYSISEVLQLLVDDPNQQHTHISIIAGYLASRGISFVSKDYSLHLTDQFFSPGKNTHGENYLQSLRILGCYQTRSQLTLWCSERTWKAINDHNKIINDLVKSVSHDREWITNIKNIFIQPPHSPLTRTNVNPRIRKISRQHFALE